MTTPILRQIAELQQKSHDELKDLWRDYFGTEPPAYRRGFLTRALAQRIQELTYGGLSPEARQQLDALVGQDPKRKGGAQGPARRLLVGTRLMREYQGVAHEVAVTAAGFEYAGRPFKSLSAVARAITGTRWNGWHFFGLVNPVRQERRK